MNLQAIDFFQVVGLDIHSRSPRVQGTELLAICGFVIGAPHVPLQVRHGRTVRIAQVIDKPDIRTESLDMVLVTVALVDKDAVLHIDFRSTVYGIGTGISAANKKHGRYSQCTENLFTFHKNPLP